MVLYDETILLTIASTVGTSIKVDPNTLNMERRKFSNRKNNKDFHRVTPLYQKKVGLLAKQHGLGMPWVSSWAAGGRDSGGFASKLFSKTCIVPQFMVVLE
ncbi:hypothetical protein JHK87_027725 [Glycine soja]|nr:hypothetical protein JHK87_027725 [Glycine soja]